MQTFDIMYHVTATTYETQDRYKQQTHFNWNDATPHHSGQTSTEVAALNPDETIAQII